MGIYSIEMLKCDVILKVDQFYQEMWQILRNSIYDGYDCYNTICLYCKVDGSSPKLCLPHGNHISFPGFPLPQMRVPTLQRGNKLACCDQAHQKFSVMFHIIKHHPHYKAVSQHCILYLALKPLLQLVCLLKKFTLSFH